MSETTDGTDLPESNVFAKPWPLDLGLPGFTAVDHADIEPTRWSDPASCWSGR